MNVQLRSLGFVCALCLVLLRAAPIRADFYCNEISESASRNRFYLNSNVSRIDDVIQDTLVSNPFAIPAQQSRAQKRSHSASLNIWLYHWTIPAFFRQACSSSCVVIDISPEIATLKDMIRNQLAVSTEILRKLHLQKRISLDARRKIMRKVELYYQRAIDTLAQTDSLAEKCQG